MSNCVPPTFCVQCPAPNPSHPAGLPSLPFLWSSVLKPVMSFCPSGSHDEVEAGCHPELWNGLRWGIQSARDYWWSRSCSVANKFDVSSAIALILTNISGNMSSYGVIWSGDADTDFQLFILMILMIGTVSNDIVKANKQKGGPMLNLQKIIVATISLGQKLSLIIQWLNHSMAKIFLVKIFLL